MTPERWQQIKAILADAIEIADPEEQANFLTQSCGSDCELLREVQSLLIQPTESLEDCADDFSLPAWEKQQTASSVGRRIGAFVLLRELGRGGMGAVWLAERADGHFKQQVAIKLLKRGTDTDEVLRRFRAERQILARLEHPNIARLLDGGETDEGLPFLVMEYVAGTRVTDYVQNEKLSVIDRLQLFRKICHAVQFAHQNLVVHRDLKPGNILVTTDGEPKLLDFGIARLLDSPDGLDLTRAEGGPRFTLASASPEQLRCETLTTVSDVYSLGALLYELLTGRSPHQFSSQHPSQEEIARVINQQTPIRPSLVGSSLARQLRGDLDTIILRALAKEPARRYASAAAFSDDLQRYLEGRPVRARPDTTWYRTTKFIGRNRLGVTAGILIFLALVGGGATTIWQARRAEHRFQDVRHLARIFLFDFHDAIAELPGSTKARQLVVRSGLEYLDNLAREAGGDRLLQLEAADAYLKVGDVQGKPYSPNLGDSSGAVISYQKAANIAEQLRPQDNHSLLIQSRAYTSLGEVESRLARLDAAGISHRRSLEISQRVLAEDPTDKKEWQQMVAASHVGLGDVIQAGNHRLKDFARFQAALDQYRAALPLNEVLTSGQPISSQQARQLSRTRSRIAGILTELGGKTGRAEFFQEALAFLDLNMQRDKALHLAELGNARYRRYLSDGLIARAYAHALARTELSDALTDCHEALALLEPLAAADPNNAEALQDLGYAIYNTALVLHVQNEWEAAGQHYERCRTLLEPLVTAHPENNETAFDLARASQGLREVEARQQPFGK